MQMHLQNTWEQVVFPGTYILKIRIYILHYSILTSTLGHPKLNIFANIFCSSVISMMCETSPFVVLALI
jgi:hypothetical protein